MLLLSTAVLRAQLPRGVLHGAGKRSEDRVVTQQVRQRRAIREVVDRHDLQIRSLLVCDAQDAASDAAEAPFVTGENYGAGSVWSAVAGGLLDRLTGLHTETRSRAEER